MDKENRWAQRIEWANEPHDEDCYCRKCLADEIEGGMENDADRQVHIDKDEGRGLK